MKSESFEFRIDGEIHVYPCLELVLIGLERKSAFLPFVTREFDEFLRRFRGDIRFVQLSDSAKARKVKLKDYEMLRFWTSDASALAEPMLGVEFHSGRVAGRSAPPDFEYLHDDPPKGKPAGIVRIALPLGDFEASVSAVREWVARLDGRDFAFGWAGHSFLWDSGEYDADEIQEWMTPLLKRHPGISLGDSTGDVTWSTSGLPTVGWLTLLGQKPLGALGGYDAVQAKAAAAGVGCERLGKSGAVLQAGALPEIGDVNRGKTLPLRRAVGKIVDPVRMSDEDIEETVWIDGFEGDEAGAWVSRFFRD